MAQDHKWSALGSSTTVMTNTNLSALANNALFLSNAYDNSSGPVWARITFIITMAVAATANTGFTLWILKSYDGGTTYESGGTGYTPLRRPEVPVCPAPVDTTQRVVSFDIILPPGFLKFLLKNDGTGQALKTDATSAGSSVTVTPFDDQAV